MKHILLSAILLACSTSCDGQSDDAASDDDAVDTDPSCTDVSCYSPCAIGAKVGEFKVDLSMEFGYTRVDGDIYDGVIPTTVPEVLQTTAECQLYGKAVYECNPPCGAGQICSHQNICIPYPRTHTVGTVTIKGMKDPIAMEPNVSNHYTNPGSLQHPGFDAGTDIALEASGGDFEPFKLFGAGVSPLVLGSEQISVEAGKDTVITWTPSAALEPARIHIVLNLDQHGGSRGRLECHVDDTGAFTIPAALVNSLIDLGLSGFPTATLTRRTSTSTEIQPGCVEFNVATGWSVDVAIPDLISCTEDTDCPQGQTCQDNFICG